MHNKKFAVLITVHNRLELTISCIRSLLAAASCSSVENIDIFLNDDGSKEDYSSLNQLFPCTRIIRSSGDLFYTRGMINAYNFSRKYGDYDFYLLVNNDVILFNDSLDSVFQVYNDYGPDVLVSGVFESSDRSRITYGGRDINDNIVTPNGFSRCVTLMNANFTLVPFIVFNKIGFFDNWFHHGLGDYDFGLRAQASGFMVRITSKSIGICDDRPLQVIPCFNLDYSIIERLRFLYSPLGPNPIRNCRFYFRHFSVFVGFRFLLVYNYRTIFPEKDR